MDSLYPHTLSSRFGQAQVLLRLQGLEGQVGKPIPQSRAGVSLNRVLGGQEDAPNTHIHHFVFGMLLMPFTFYALYWRLWFGPILAGVVMALVFSEIRELIFMNWQQ